MSYTEENLCIKTKISKLMKWDYNFLTRYYLAKDTNMHESMYGINFIKHSMLRK